MTNYLSYDRYEQIKNKYNKCNQSISYYNRHLFKEDFYCKYHYLDISEKSKIGKELSNISVCTFFQLENNINK
tara:strand:+ start:567 stop:785 length:219 start_codon:yes stop_codon:yes gene_type:complete